jgi:hypothetical protein
LPDDGCEFFGKVSNVIVGAGRGSTPYSRHEGKAWMPGQRRA